MKTTPFKRLWELVRIERTDIASIYFYAILSGLVQLSLPLGIQTIIGYILGATMVTSIYILIVLVVLGVAVVGFMQINQMKIIETIKQKLFTRYSLEFAEAIPNFDSLKTDGYYLPEKVNRFFDILNVQKGLSKLLLDVPVASIQIIFGLMLLGIYHLAFFVFGSLLLLVLWLVFYRTGSKGVNSSLQESMAKYKVAAWLEEMARVINPFKNNRDSPFNLQKTDAYVSQYLEAKTTHFRVLLVQYQVLVFLKVAITAGMLTVGTVLLLDQKLNIGEFIAIEIVILMVINAVEKLIINLDSVYDVVTGLEKLATVTEPLGEQQGAIVLEQKAKGIALEMKDFYFHFSNGKPVFEGVNLAIQPGTITTITTSSKTVLLQTLAGYYSPQAGALLINGIPMSHYNLTSFRQQIGMYLNQKDIFIGTVMENILMGRLHIIPDHITELAIKLEIQDIITSLPAGFQTTISPNGRNLEGRHIRAILLLRALVHTPRLLLLESPWDGLTPHIRTTIIAYLQSIKERTTIVITSDEPNLKEIGDFHIYLNHGESSPNKPI
ncbi:ABC-type bacteriocin/lantibiotic exporter with double-glycine peptidase domain [Dyadobacter jejuensis]|uniref:ABC-type bacteriocin/lantibiotic exporter with double-glycine peptidase domain n=1 Tax=Dyadobacter jejuensis TaxID=1082580 RepID=A0A316AJB6_9BACT|nr:ATP-binding cassette domain-containing protein [Dyadobacter jejuensis]PWJ57776.1 ABC-type bacteriocin/lantibiotic exporter with double-glycine peptidase domain [Dyadobacter jejuensis]